MNVFHISTQLSLFYKYFISIIIFIFIITINITVVYYYYYFVCFFFGGGGEGGGGQGCVFAPTFENEYTLGDTDNSILVAADIVVDIMIGEDESQSVKPTASSIL